MYWVWVDLIINLEPVKYLKLKMGLVPNMLQKYSSTYLKTRETHFPLPMMVTMLIRGQRRVVMVPSTIQLIWMILLFSWWLRLVKMKMNTWLQMRGMMKKAMVLPMTQIQIQWMTQIGHRKPKTLNFRMHAVKMMVRVMKSRKRRIWMETWKVIKKKITMIPKQIQKRKGRSHPSTR